MVPPHGDGECESHGVELPVGHTLEYFWALVHKRAHRLARMNLIGDGLARACTSIEMAAEE